MLPLHTHLKPAKQTGFTLLEVMVAALIMGLTLVTFSEVNRQSLTSIEHLQHQQAARWVAHNLLTEAVLSRPSAAKKGSQSFAGQEYIWRLSLLPSPSPEFRLYQVQVTLPNEKAFNYHLSELTTLVQVR